MDECIATPLCAKNVLFTPANTNVMTKFFCGHHPDCAEDNNKTLDRALHVLVDQYAVVGTILLTCMSLSINIDAFYVDLHCSVCALC